MSRDHARRINGTHGAIFSGERCECTFSSATSFEFTLVQLVEAAYKVENEAEDFEKSILREPKVDG